MAKWKRKTDLNNDIDYKEQRKRIIEHLKRKRCSMDKRFSILDNIDISLYLVYKDIGKIMEEIETDYGEIFSSINRLEFRRYISQRYHLM